MQENNKRICKEINPMMEKGEMGISQVKEAALRELAPILSKLDVPYFKARFNDRF